MSDKDIIKNEIIKLKPNISDSSVNTYNSILKNLYKNVFKSTDIDLKNFEKTAPIISYLKDLEPRKRKTILASLVVITDNKRYRDQMLKDIEEYRADESKQIKSEKQSDSWLEKSEINDIFNDMTTNVNILYKKKTLTMSDLQDIQNYIILCVLSGIFIPPRRSKDYVDFKIRDIDREKDNYIDKKTMVFNSYKTAKTYQRQEIPIPPELLKILNKWIKVNPTDYLLFDSNSKKLSNVKLTQRLNKIFGKKASVNQLRHSYLSNKYQDTIKLNKDMADDMEAMGSSRKQEQIYIKKD
jgi:integrase